MNSYLSANVQKLLRLSVEPCHDRSINEQALQCLRKEGQVWVFEDQPIQFLLGSVIIDDYSSRTKEWYKVVLRRLSPLFNYCHKTILNENFSEDLDKDQNLAWLTNPELVCESIKLLQFRDDKCVSQEVFLALTPMLERSLGNILYTSNSKLKIPSLLRDLIYTQELYDIIKSPILMLILHVMIGTPQGLNLRNLVWHGFTKPGEISNVLASSFIVLLFSIGETLENFGSIQPRNCLDLLGPRGFMAKIERIYSSIPYTIDELTDEFIANISPDNIKGPFLQRVPKLLKKNKFRQALYLIIPEWEAQARKLFIHVNNCPLRILTAENDKLYTTFDEILSKILDETRENSFPLEIGPQHMEFFIDCLVLPEGPRLRDKISHGEIGLGQDLISSVFRMCIYVIMASFNDLSKFLNKDFDKTLILQDYSALFHPKKMLMEEIDEMLIEVENLNDHPSLYNTNDLGPDDPLTQLQPRFQKCLEFICEEHYDNDFQALRRYVSTVGVETLYRPKYEYVITAMFRRLLTQMRLTLDHTMKNMDDKMLKAADLNQRQLSTYAKMLESVPRICRLFTFFALMIILNVENFQDRTDVFKVFKKMLKYTENLREFSQMGKNKWHEAENYVSKAANLILDKEFLQRELNAEREFFKPNSSAIIQDVMPQLAEINTQ